MAAELKIARQLLSDSEELLIKANSTIEEAAKQGFKL